MIAIAGGIILAIVFILLLPLLLSPFGRLVAFVAIVAAAGLLLLTLFLVLSWELAFLGALIAFFALVGYVMSEARMRQAAAERDRKWRNLLRH